MRNYYSTVNRIILTHSDMQHERTGRRVYVRFERPNSSGFDYAEGTLPECVFQKTFGFSEDELFELLDYLRCNSMLIWDYAQKGAQPVGAACQPPALVGAACQPPAL